MAEQPPNPDAFVSLTRAPQVRVASELTAPPSHLYVTPDDVLLVNCVHPFGQGTATVRARIMEPGGRISTIEQAVVLPPPGVDPSLNIPLYEGWLISATVSMLSGTGETYFRLSLVRGAAVPNSAFVLALLAAGFVTSRTPLTWPGNMLKTPLEAPGRLRSIVGTDPAAGVEILETVPAGVRWELLAVWFQLVTDATVASRAPVLIIDDGVNTIVQARDSTAQTATRTDQYTAGPGMSAPTPGGFQHYIPIPIGLVLQSSYRVRTSTFAFQAGDDYGAPTLYVREWLVEG